MGIIVETVEDSDKLDRRLREKKFDLVVSDLRREGSPRAGLDYFIPPPKVITIAAEPAVCAQNIGLTRCVRRSTICPMLRRIS